MSICSQEVNNISSKMGYTRITEITDDRPASPVPFKREPLDHKLIKTVKETAMRQSSKKVELSKEKTEKLDTKNNQSRKSPIPATGRPHEIKSLLVDASIVRPLSPVQVVVFPPELPEMLPVVTRTPTPASSKSRTLSPAKITNNIPSGRRSKSPKGKKIVPSIKSSDGSVSVKQKVYEFETPQAKEKMTKSIRDLPKPIMESGFLALALTTAPTKPFKPQLVKDRALVPTGKIDLPPDSNPYFPPEHGSKDEKIAQAMREAGCKSPMTELLTTAPERSFSPLPPATESISTLTTKTSTVISQKNVDSSETTTTKSSVGFQPIRKPVSIATALTVAPSVPFTVPGKTPLPTDSSLPVPSAFKPISSTSPTFVPVPGRPHSPMKYYPMYTKVPQPSPPPEVTRGEFTDKEHIKYDSTLKPKSHSPKPPSPSPVSTKMVKESTTVTGKTNITKSKQITKSTEKETFLLPYYQQNIGEIPVRYLDHTRSVSPIRQIKAPSFSPADKMLHPPANVKQMTQTKVDNQVQPRSEHGTRSAFGLHSPDFLPAYQVLLPYYQQNIGEIPVRNKSVSPAPHPIRAPSFEPSKMVSSPQNYCYSSNSTVPTYGYRPSSATSLKSTQTQTELPQVKQIKEVIKESTSEETNKRSKEEKEVHKSVTKMTQEVLRPASPASWKVKVEKTVQNLSPMTVRIASPVPKPQGHTYESVGSNIHITHHRDHHTSVSVTPIPDDNNNLQNSKGKIKPSSNINKSDASTNKTGSASKHISFATGHQTSAHNVVQGTTTHYKEKSEANTIKQVGVEDREISKRMSKQITEDRGGTLASPNKSTQKRSCSPIPTIKITSQNSGPSTSKDTKSETSKDTLQKIQTSQKSILTEKNAKAYASQKISSGLSKTMSKTIVTGGSGQSLSLGLSSPMGVSLSGDNGTGGGSGVGGKGSVAGSTAPRRGRGVLNPNTGPQARIPLCGQCNRQIRGPFITALGKIWCPEHFVCVNAQCKRPLQDIGFVEEQEGLYCEFCYEKYLAPNCSKCNNKIKGDCLNAIGKQFHPECFCCTYCGKMFGNNPFFLEDSLPYCEADWNELFTTKCFACGFPIEAGDRWVEALSNNYHSQCFNCTMCKKNLEGQSFYAKGGRPFCKNHAR